MPAAARTWVPGQPPTDIDAADCAENMRGRRRREPAIGSSRRGSRRVPIARGDLWGGAQRGLGIDQCRRSTWASARRGDAGKRSGRTETAVSGVYSLLGTVLDAECGEVDLVDGGVDLATDAG